MMSAPPPPAPIGAIICSSASPHAPIRSSPSASESPSSISGSIAADRIAQLDAQIASMESNKLGPDTTVEDMYAQYPEVGEEIEQEIADMDWKKDT